MQDNTNSKECYITYKYLYSTYTGFCPQCEEEIEFYFSTEEEWNVEHGYHLNDICPHCGQYLILIIA